MAHLRKEEIQSSNLDVDYVINFRYAKDTAKSAAQFQSLCRALVDIGLDIEARDGDYGSILLFTKVESPKYLAGEVYRSRIKDWLYGIRLSAPETETRESLDGEPVNVGERLRVVYLLITSPPSEGGAGVTPGQGQWDCVESVFALHDHDFNKRWMKTWNSKYFLDTGDLTDIRNHHGEKVCCTSTDAEAEAYDESRSASILHSYSLTSDSSPFLQSLVHPPITSYPTSLWRTV